MTAPLNSTSSTRPLLRGLIAVVTLWGIYLAIGATGWFTDHGLFDARRSVIVLLCSGVFVTWWIWLVRSLSRRDNRDMTRSDLTATSGAPTTPTTTESVAKPATAFNSPTAGLTNYVSLSSLVTNLIAWGLWAGASYAWRQHPGNGFTVPGGWIAVLLMGVSSILALIGLSDPRRRRWQLAGLWTLLLIAAAFVTFWRIVTSS